MITQPLLSSTPSLDCYVSAHKGPLLRCLRLQGPVYWIVDDGSYPRPVPRLQDAVKTQVGKDHVKTECISPLPTSPALDKK